MTDSTHVEDTIDNSKEIKPTRWNRNANLKILSSITENTISEVESVDRSTKESQYEAPDLADAPITPATFGSVGLKSNRQQLQ